MHRAFGFRFVIFVNHHGPPHVHVVGPGGEARVILDGPDGLDIDWVVGIGRLDLRRILHEIEQMRDDFLAR
ncbi:MAG: DUF4160 domain-containing protein [Alphaproteobacteria bacterium]|nr:DUF4160 domain-containing protein [Alphaproteobacteria bacterium]